MELLVKQLLLAFCQSSNITIEDIEECNVRTITGRRQDIHKIGIWSNQYYYSIQWNEDLDYITLEKSD